MYAMCRASKHPQAWQHSGEKEDVSEYTPTGFNAPRLVNDAFALHPLTLLSCTHGQALN